MAVPHESKQVVQITHVTFFLACSPTVDSNLEDPESRVGICGVESFMCASTTLNLVMCTCCVAHRYIAPAEVVWINTLGDGW